MPIQRPRTLAFASGYGKCNVPLTLRTDFNTDGSERIIGYTSGLTVTGTSGNDVFVLRQAPDVTANGGGGNDVFYFGSSFSAADQINGGAGRSVMILDGDYTGANAVVFGATTIADIAALQLTGGHSYDFTLNQGNVAAGQVLTVNAAALKAGDIATVDGSALTQGQLHFVGGAGTDVFTGGSGNDVFDVTAGGTYTLAGGGGDDWFYVGGGLTAADKIDGGTGYDHLVMNGDYSGAHALTFGASTITNIETIQLVAGHSYNLTLNAGNLGTGQVLTVNGSGLGASDSLTLNGSAIATGSLVLEGGGGNDVLIGGAGNVTFDGGLGADTMTCGSAHNRFVYHSVAESTGVNYDAIIGYSAYADSFMLPTAVTGIDPTVTSGTLDTVNFDAELSAAIGSAQLLANHAVLFTPNSGSLAGDTFLIVDANGTAGYQAGQDYVIELTNGTHLNHLSTADFII